jgi:hypothetical protein
MSGWVQATSQMYMVELKAGTVEGIRAFAKEQGMDIQDACDSLQVI